MGGGMDTNIYIACLRQVVAFAPKVVIATKVVIVLLQGSYSNQGSYSVIAR